MTLRRVYRLPWVSTRTDVGSCDRGRQLTDDFKSLPDRKAWAEYYKVIMHPLAIDMVTVRLLSPSLWSWTDLSSV